MRWWCWDGCVEWQTRRDKIRNERTGGTTKVVQTSKKTIEKQLKWHSHVTRMKVAHIVRRILAVGIPGTRRKWRPTMMCQYACKRDMSEMCVCCQSQLGDDHWNYPCSSTVDNVTSRRLAISCCVYCLLFLVIWYKMSRDNRSGSRVWGSRWHWASKELPNREQCDRTVFLDVHFSQTRQGWGTLCLQATTIDGVELRAMKWFDNHGVMFLSRHAVIEATTRLDVWQEVETHTSIHCITTKSTSSMWRVRLAPCTTDPLWDACPVQEVVPACVLLLLRYASSASSSTGGMLMPAACHVRSSYPSLILNHI